MITLRVHTVVGAALLALAACATLSEDDCREGNWTDIGVRDGANGRSPEFLDQHREACAKFGIAVNPSEWEAGRQQGLKSYCTRSNVYREGAKGRRLRPVCPAEAQDALELANDRGLTWYRIGQDIADLERDIRDINRELSSLPADSPARASLISQRSFLRLRILNLRARRALFRL